MTAKKKVDQFIIVSKWESIEGPFAKAELEAELADVYSFEGDLGGITVYKLTEVKAVADVSISIAYPAAGAA